MERIRDFLYDISDLLISLLIIAAIFMVISWKLNESIPIDGISAPQTIEEPAAIDADALPPNAESTTPTETVEPVSDASDADKPIGEVTPTDTTKPLTPAPTPAPTTVKNVSITIPSGSPGITIGKILKDNGLITDVNAFIKKVDEMGFGPKLRSGTYKLKTGMTLEQIINILANAN